MINIFKNILKGLIPGTYQYLSLRKTVILSNYQKKERVPNLIVSLTTYGPRLNIFEFSILSLLNGSLLPNRILIYVPKGFKSKVVSNPQSFLKNHIDNGLIYMIEMEEDLGCHSKYYYSFKEYGMDNDIIICDDDVVYYKNWLKDLYEYSMEEPDSSILGFKVVNVKVDNNTILPYDDWEHCSPTKPARGLLYAEGVGGVFYRRGKLINEVLNKEVFLDLAPKADDVWLWFNAYLSKAKIKYVLPKKSEKLLYVIPNSQVVNLWSENTINRRNDIYVENCNQYFKDNYNMDITQLL